MHGAGQRGVEDRVDLPTDLAPATATAVSRRISCAATSAGEVPQNLLLELHRLCRRLPRRARRYRRRRFPARRAPSRYCAPAGGCAGMAEQLFVDRRAASAGCACPRARPHGRTRMLHARFNHLVDDRGVGTRSLSRSCRRTAEQLTACATTCCNWPLRAPPRTAQSATTSANPTPPARSERRRGLACNVHECPDVPHSKDRGYLTPGGSRSRQTAN